VEQVWQNIQDTEINIVGSGSSVECWFGGKKLQTLPAKHYQETCVTATWIKLNQQLLRLTGEAKYADAIENAFYNALLGAVRADGRQWAKYSPLAGVRQAGEEQCGMGMNCCEASGPRALFTLPLTAVMQEKSGISVQFFNEGSCAFKTPKGQVGTVIQQTDYPVSGEISLKVQLAKPEQMALRVRIPAWSTTSQAWLNGQPVTGLSAGKYLVINRKWQNNDEVKVSLDLRGRVIQAPDGQSIALQRGPLVLARDTQLGPPAVDEVVTPAVDKEGVLPMELANENGRWITLKIPCVIGTYREGELGKPRQVRFCDYASAGGLWEPDNRFRVWFPQLLDPEK
jgi:hypothetical protein